MIGFFNEPQGTISLELTQMFSRTNAYGIISCSGNSVTSLRLALKCYTCTCILISHHKQHINIANKSTSQTKHPYTEHIHCFFYCLFWFFTFQSTVFLGWTSTKQRINCLAQENNAVPPVKLEPATPWSWVKYSTTESLHFSQIHCNISL